GTLPYMAPEQFSGKADERTDIYQAGAVLYELATGRRALGATQPAALINAILHSTPQLPRALNAALSADFDPILMKAIDKDPALRSQRAGEFAISLHGLRCSSSRVAVRPHEKTRWGLPIAAGSAAVLALAGGLFWFA